MLTYSGCYDGTASHLASQGSGNHNIEFNNGERGLE